MKQSSVVIVGLSRLFRDGLHMLLRRHRFVVITKTATLGESIGSFAASRPDLIIYAMAGGDEAKFGIDLVRANRTTLEGIRLVLLTDQLNAEGLREAASAGVHGVLSNDISGEVLQRSLELVVLGQQLYPSIPDEPRIRPAAALIPFNRPLLAAVCSAEIITGGPVPINRLFVQPTYAMAPQRSTALSDRERQILRCLVEGAANKTIARDLQITEATVKVHIKGLLRKIRVTNRTQAAVWGLNNTGLLDSADTSAHDDERHRSRSGHAVS